MIMIVIIVKRYHSPRASQTCVYVCVSLATHFPHLRSIFKCSICGCIFVYSYTVGINLPPKHRKAKFRIAAHTVSNVAESFSSTENLIGGVSLAGAEEVMGRLGYPDTKE